MHRAETRTAAVESPAVAPSLDQQVKLCSLSTMPGSGATPSLDRAETRTLAHGAACRLREASLVARLPLDGTE